jgi:DNA repair protein RecN (Recombination protein N)
MLSSLEIRDILLIEDIKIDFTDGLNVFTGETGAGKSILLDCISFVLGFRGRSSYVRRGADYGEVIATFELPADHKIWQKFEDAGFENFDYELVVKRKSFRDGKKIAFINEKRCSNQILREFSKFLIEIQDQNDDNELRNETGPRTLLDIFGNLVNEVSEVGSVWKAISTEKSLLSELTLRESDSNRDRAYFTHAIEEIECLSPEVGEELNLTNKRRIIKNSEKVKNELNETFQILEGAAVEQNIDQALRLLTRLEAKSELELEDVVESLEQGSSLVAHVKKNIADMISNLDFEGHILEEVEDRLYKLKDLSRKYNVPSDGLNDLAREFSKNLNEVDHLTDAKEKSILRIHSLEDKYQKLAESLSKDRLLAAKKLNSAMGDQLPSLKLDQAQFKVDIELAEAGPYGIDKIAFNVSTNSGMPLAPIAKTASGGEFSRFLLALKVSIAGLEDNATLIFDEIDSGVGGATADAVGQRLRELARGSQILVVTHSPQVAALGNHHIKVVKMRENTSNTINIVRLDSAERVDEIGRMLSGGSLTAEAQSAAKVLLQG